MLTGTDDRFPGGVPRNTKVDFHAPSLGERHEIPGFLPAPAACFWRRQLQRPARTARRRSRPYLDGSESCRPRGSAAGQPLAPRNRPGHRFGVRRVSSGSRHRRRRRIRLCDLGRDGARCRRRHAPRLATMARRVAWYLSSRSYRKPSWFGSRSVIPALAPSRSVWRSCCSGVSAPPVTFLIDPTSSSNISP